MLKTRRWTGFVLLAILMTIGLIGTAAQEATDEPAPPTEIPITPQQVVTIRVDSVAPSQIFAGQSTILNLTGENFTATTVVKLLGVANPLPTTMVNAQNIKAAVTGELAVGQYIIEVSDPNDPSRGTDVSKTLTVVKAPVPTEAPTFAPPPTAAPPPTDIPGAPSLLVRSFSANPTTIKPGDTVTFTLEIVNSGSRPAQGVSLSVDSGGHFIAANGQAAVLLPDLGVGASYTVTLSVVAATDTPGGPQSAAITMNFRDFSGTTYTGKASLSVTVQTVSTASQVTLSRYLVDPNPVLPGQPVTITVLLSNTGNETAGQVLLQIGEGILLAGPEGNSFAFGDLEAGSSASMDLPLIVSTTAKSGPQAQAVTINFLQNGETTSTTSSMTLEVDNVVAPAPLLLLDSYEYGADFLQPGEQFTLTMNLKNIGDADANNMLVTFGTVESSGGNNNATPDGSTGGSSTNTTPSSTFAPLGSGGTQFAGTLTAGSDGLTLTQEFIVSGSVDSGIYSLPVTLRYNKPDGTSTQDSLRASIVVIVPPNLLITEASPLPETVNAGEPVFISLTISNKGRKQVNLSNVTVSTDNGDVQEGADTYLGPLRVDDDTSMSTLVIPTEVGLTKITVTFNYTDDLNQRRTIVEEYEVEAVEPPPPPDMSNEPPPDAAPPPTPEPTDPNEIIGRILFGLLGLGS